MGTIFDMDGAAVVFYQVFDGSEADTGTFGAVARRAQALEKVEDPLAVGGHDTGAVVGNAEGGTVDTRSRRSGHADVAAPGRVVMDGVEQ